MNTIAAEWDSFCARAMPEDAPPIQVTEMRRAFYMGAVCMLRLQLGASDKSVSEDAAVMMLQGWHDECDLFAQQLSEGAA